MLGSGYVDSYMAPTAGSLTGPELITNGDMGSSTGWTVGTNWAIAGGVATHTAGAGGDLSQFVLTGGLRFRVYFTIVLQTAGNLTVSIGSGTVSGNFTAAGNYEFVGICAGSTTFSLSADAACDAVVDNVSVTQIPFA